MITVNFVNQYTATTVPDGVTVKFYAASDTTLTTVLDTQTMSGSKVTTSALSAGNSYQFVLSGTGAPTTKAHTFAVRDSQPTASFLADLLPVQTTTKTGTAFPASPVAGEMFYRTDTKILSVFDGTNWVSSRDGTTQV